MKILLNMYHHVWWYFSSFICKSSRMEESLTFNDELYFQSHNILMDEHNEYLLQVYVGVFEVLSESSS